MQSLSNNNKSYPLFAPSWGNEEKQAVADVLAGDYLNEGKYVREFERLFAEYVGAQYCILVPNGALALSLAVEVADKKLHFAIPDYYGIFAANALFGVRRWPELIDVDKATACVKENTTKYQETLPIHVNGRLGTTSKGSIIEDCGQAPNHHSKGLISCYSFHSTKLITCAGIGGAVCVDDKEQYERMSAIKDHGRPERAQGNPVTDNHTYWGTNMKMSDVNAAFGIEQLKKLTAKIDRLHNIYGLYRDLLGDKVTWLDGIPSWRIDCLVDNPQQFAYNMKFKGIDVKGFYKPTHQQAQYLEADDKFPNTMHLYQHGVYLPSSPNLTDAGIHYICASVKECLK